MYFALAAAAAAGTAAAREAAASERKGDMAAAGLAHAHAFVRSHNASVPPAPPNNASSTNTSCFLDRFRSYTRKQAKEQGIKYSQKFGRDVSFGGLAFNIVMLVGGSLLLLCGWKLAAVLFVASGFGAGTVLSFYATSTIMNAAGWSNCAVLAIVPLVAGVVAAVAMRKLPKLCFFVLGAFVGATGASVHLPFPHPCLLS